MFGRMETWQIGLCLVGALLLAYELKEIKRIGNSIHRELEEANQYLEKISDKLDQS